MQFFVFHCMADMLLDTLHSISSSGVVGPLGGGLCGALEKRDQSTRAVTVDVAFTMDA